MKSTKGVIRTAYNDGAKHRSTGFTMHRQIFQDENGSARYVDVKRIHFKDGKQIGSAKVKGVSIKLFKPEDYPAWKELKGVGVK